jgi:Cu+-exporting ATPase
MQTNAAIGVVAVLFLVGCAATTPAPRFSDVSPADKDGPEAGTPPPSPALAGEPEAQAVLPPADAPKPAAGHEGHPMPAETPASRGHEGHSPAAPATTSPADQPYSCPMHPEVKQASPGSCPKCGMTLVRRMDEKEQP